ncbi:MAG: P1 family peptidase [Bacteriovoracaceae bacterium]|nr:P1 family peptidase [Bacteriovoracaceae bacterium]
MKRCSCRELGIIIGKFDTGAYNNITDVKGVKVGHVTLNSGEDTRTGVTVLVPNEKIFNDKLVASSFILNGAGEVSGLIQINEWGLLETPIALTNTMSIGNVSNGISKWMSKRFEKIWNTRDVVIPVVGECDDSFLNNTNSFPIKTDHVLDCIKNVKGGAFEQGSVGAGTGMICCDFKAGVGSSSRVIKIDGCAYTIGILVISNFGHMRDLRVDGFPIGRILEAHQGNYCKRTTNYGSVITIIATDIPTSSHQVQKLCKRAALGIGRVGSYAAHGSGEIIVGFSTANVIKHASKKPHYRLNIILDTHLNCAYEATIEAVEEAILNSMTYSDSMAGIDGNVVPGVDLKLLKRLYKDFTDLEKM